jgi:putative peptidoglycan lipid II flippase
VIEERPIETTPPPPDGIPLPPDSISQDKRLVKAAGILAMGNVASRVLGLGREMVKAYLFGSSGILSAYETAVLIPNSLFDLIIGGMVNSALVPVFSDYASEEKREELWSVVSSVMTLAAVVLLVLIGFVELFTPQAAWLAGAVNFTDVELTDVSMRLMRLAAPAVFFLSLASILTGVLFALKRFTLPAFVGAVFNGTIVVVALLRPENVSSLVYGMLIGGVLQIVLQLPALRGAKIRFKFDPTHPAIKRIVWLYAPILAGIIVNQMAIFFAYNLANRTGDSSLTYMRYATTLYQFPLGLVVTALSIATLPTLSQQASGKLAIFKRTMADGIRLVMALILPATAGLFALATPIIILLFQRGEFNAADTIRTAEVLRVFLFGMPFAALDQMLVFASYARKDTWRPALVGVISILIYSFVAWALLDRLGLLSLMVADAVKHVVHTALMLLILQRQLGGLRGHGVTSIVLKSLLASLLTGLTAYGVAMGLQTNLPIGGLLASVVVVGGAGLAGVLVYAGMARLLNISDVQAMVSLISKKTKR